MFNNPWVLFALAALLLCVAAGAWRFAVPAPARTTLPRHHTVTMAYEDFARLIRGQEVVLRDRLDTVGITLNLPLTGVEALVSHARRQQVADRARILGRRDEDPPLIIVDDPHEPISDSVDEARSRGYDDGLGLTSVRYPDHLRTVAYAEGRALRRHLGTL